MAAGFDGLRFEHWQVETSDDGIVLVTIDRAGPAVLYIVNYGRPQDLPVLARIQGAFTKATLLRPEAAPQTVKVSRRGSSSEATLPGLERVGAVVFG